MRIMIDLPPAMAQEAQEYAMALLRKMGLEGTTLERVLLDCIKTEMERRRTESETATQLMDRWRAVVRKGRGRRTEPYVFNRADAYSEGEFA